MIKVVGLASAHRLRELIGALLRWRFLERVVPPSMAGYVAVATGVLLASAGIGVILAHSRIGGLAMLYLLVVLPIAIRFGRGPAIFACVAASLTYDFFFVPPLHTFTMADPEEWIAILLFVIVAVVASQLAVAQRQRADEAQRREREAAALHRLGRTLSASDDLDAALQGVTDHLREVLGLDGCAILLPVPGESDGRVAVRASSGMALAGIAERTPWLAPRATPLAGEPGGERGRQSHHWIRIHWPVGRVSKGAPYRVEYVPLVAGEQTVGMLCLVVAAQRVSWAPEEARLLSAAADQIGRAVERARLRQVAMDTEVLRKTDEVRRAILHAVSHDLRTPLALIKGSAESLLQPEILWSEERRRAYLVAIRQEAERLHRLVERLLELGRIEAGKLMPEREWYPLDVLVDDVLGRLESVIGQHPVTVDVPEDLPPVPLDYVQIGEVLTNLIENAAQYTPPEAAISVRAHLEGDAVRVSVADEGPGIPAAALPHVFDAFYRVSGGDRAAVKGTGLGLAVARAFVEAHGGTITVQSPAPGQSRGTLFSFTLPLAPAGFAGLSPDPDRPATSGRTAASSAAAPGEARS